MTDQLPDAKDIRRIQIRTLVVAEIRRSLFSRANRCRSTCWSGCRWR